MMNEWKKDQENQRCHEWGASYLIQVQEQEKWVRFCVFC